MQDVDEIINEATDVREVKRALSVKMGLTGVASAQICQVLNVSPKYVSKEKGQYKTGGAAALRLGYCGSEDYLREGQRQELVQWVGEYETLWKLVKQDEAPLKNNKKVLEHPVKITVEGFIFLDFSRKHAGNGCCTNNNSVNRCDRKAGRSIHFPDKNAPSRVRGCWEIHPILSVEANLD
jgi:transposase